MKHLFVAAYGSPASKQENLDKILQYCAVPAERAVFFGDAGSDFEAASACGVGFAGVGDSIAKMLNKLNSQWPLIEDFRGINDLLATR